MVIHLFRAYIFSLWWLQYTLHCSALLIGEASARKSLLSSFEEQIKPFSAVFVTRIFRWIGILLLAIIFVLPLLIISSILIFFYTVASYVTIITIDCVCGKIWWFGWARYAYGCFYTWKHIWHTKNNITSHTKCLNFFFVIVQFFLLDYLL